MGSGELAEREGHGLGCGTGYVWLKNMAVVREEALEIRRKRVN